MKKCIALLLSLLVISTCLFGCVGKNKKKQIRIGTEATFAPFEFIDDEDKYAGFDIDIAEYLAQENNWDYKVVNIAFDSLLDSLVAGEVDMVIAAMTIDDDRSQLVDFSIPYYDASQIIVVRAEDQRDFTSEAIVNNNMKIAVQLGTTGSAEAVALLGSDKVHNLYEHKRVDEVFAELENGRVDLVIIDQPVAKNYIINTKAGLRIHGEPFTEEKFGIAVQKGQKELLNRVNISLNKLLISDEYQRLYKKWFGDDE